MCPNKTSDWLRRPGLVKFHRFINIDSALIDQIYLKNSIITTETRGKSTEKLGKLVKSTKL